MNGFILGAIPAMFGHNLAICSAILNDKALVMEETKLKKGG
jgi:hypothetical protein